MNDEIRKRCFECMGKYNNRCPKTGSYYYNDLYAKECNEVKDE